MRFTNISPSDKLKIVTLNKYAVIDGDPRFNREYAEFNAKEMAEEWIKHRNWESNSSKSIRAKNSETVSEKKRSDTGLTKTG